MFPELTEQEADDRIEDSRPAVRVTNSLIQSKIKKVTYHVDGTTTVAFILLQNGFKFIGHSTPTDPKVFDAEVGKRKAYDNALSQIRPYEGYSLKTKQAEQNAG